MLSDFKPGRGITFLSMLQITGWTFSPSQRVAKIPCFKLLPGETLTQTQSFSQGHGQIDGKITRIITINCMFLWYFWYVLASSATWHARNQQLALEGHVFQPPSPRAFPPKRPGPTEHPPFTSRIFPSKPIHHDSSPSERLLLLGILQFMPQCMDDHWLG